MPDKLTQMYDAYRKSVADPTDFQLFQGGVTAGAVSMRERAIAVVKDAIITVRCNDARNALLTAIGRLSDIPE